MLTIIGALLTFYGLYITDARYMRWSIVMQLTWLCTRTTLIGLYTYLSFMLDVMLRASGVTLIVCYTMPLWLNQMYSLEGCAHWGRLH